MYQITIKSKPNFGNGYFQDKNGNSIPMQNFSPNIGDSFLSTTGLVEKYIFNQNLKGVEYPIKIEGMPTQYAFIQEKDIEIVPVNGGIGMIPENTKPIGTNPIYQKSSVSQNKNQKYIIIAVTIIALISIHYYYKSK